MMDDELDKFIKQHKSRVAEDKTSLEQGPPAYLEIRKNDHMVYNATLKENIAPIKSSTAQEKDESCCLSLPLGEDYEKKKLKLQQELRLDYRRYIAQLDSVRDTSDLTDAHYSPRPRMAPPPERAPSRRDVATLTDGVLIPKERARMIRVDFNSDEDLTEEELGLMERRRLRQTELERGEEKRRHRQHYTTDFREMSRLRNKRSELPDDYKETRHFSDRKTSGSFLPDVDYLEARLCASSLTPKPKLQGPAQIQPNKDEPEFATGLIIGASDAEAALQRRKERYRQELEEQIAEQQRNRKREKDLELRVALTGATDPEKERDRLKPLGVVNSGEHARRRRDVSYRSGQAVGLAGDVLHGRPHDENRERVPPEQPGVAFQSPLLEYSHSLGLDIGGTAPYSQANPRNGLNPRISGILPHTSSRLSDVVRTPYEEAYIYYGARNPLEPNLAYYGQIPQPMSYQSLPPPGPHPSQMGPYSDLSRTSHPEPFPQNIYLSRRASDAVTSSSGPGVLPAEQVKPSNESGMSYKEALRQQIRDQQERRRLDKEEQDRYEARLEADLKNHDPWGRGGGGAPLRDSGGNLITDLHQMHKQNKEAYINPETWQKRGTSTMEDFREEQSRPPSTHRRSGFVQAPTFARGSVFGNVPTPQQVNEQDQYKAYLKQQIEEKRRKEAEERERQRLEEEKEEKRLAEQRESIQREYENEQERKKRKEMEQKAKNEELIRLAEERKKEAETKKKQAEDKENAALRKQYEEERQTRLQQVPREASPPIPTLQKRHASPHYTPRPPSMDSRRSTAVPLSERSLSGLQSPPVPARRNQLRAAEDQHGVIRELSALRRQLRSQQKRLEGQLLQSEWEELDSPRCRDMELPQVDVFDMARRRLQAPVRRSSSRNMEDNNLQMTHDPLRFRNRDNFELPTPQQQNYYLRNAEGHPIRGSLLESESAFIDPMGGVIPVPITPEQKTQLSARERRRRSRRTDLQNETQVFNLLQMNTGLDAEKHHRDGHHHRSDGLPAVNRHSLRTADRSGDDDASLQGSPYSPDPRGSVDSVATETWMRPGTSETLKRLMSGQTLRRERLTRESAIQDWEGPSTYHG